MILILIALVTLTALSIWVATHSFSIIGDIFSPVFMIIGFMGLIVYGVLGFDYFAAEYKANIINREYDTNYTQAEVFYASDVIDTVRELNRKRVEVNGNLITGEQK